MVARSFTVAVARTFVPHVLRVAALTGVAMALAAAPHAQEADAARAEKKQ